MKTGYIYLFVAIGIGSLFGIVSYDLGVPGVLVAWLMSLFSVVFLYAYFHLNRTLLRQLRAIRLESRTFVFPLAQSTTMVFFIMAVTDPNFPAAGCELIVNATPLLIIFLAPVILGEKSSLRELSAALVGLIGILAYLYGVQVLDQDTSVFSTGLLFGLIALVTNSFAIIFNRRAADLFDPYILAFLVALCGVVFTTLMIPLVALNEVLLYLASLENTLPVYFDLGRITLMAGMNLAVITLICLGLRSVRPQIWSSMQLGKPAIASGLNFLVLGQSVNMLMAIGGLVTIASVGIALYKPIAKLLHIPAAKATPEIFFDYKYHRLVIKGDSYPENRDDADRFFDPIFKSLDTYLEKTKLCNIRVDLVMGFINNVTSRKLFVLLESLQASTKAAQNSVTVVWHYDRDDDLALETGEAFRDEFEEIDFVFKPVTQSAPPKRSEVDPNPEVLVAPAAVA